MPIKITNVEVREISSSVAPDLAYIAKVVVNDELIINDIRIYRCENGDFKVNLPNHPIAIKNGTRIITTKSRRSFDKIKSAIVKEILKNNG